MSKNIKSAEAQGAANAVVTIEEIINHRKEELKGYMTLSEYKDYIQSLIDCDEYGQITIERDTEKIGWGGALEWDLSEMEDGYDNYSIADGDQEKWEKYQEWAKQYNYDEIIDAEEILFANGYEFNGCSGWNNCKYNYIKN